MTKVNDYSILTIVMQQQTVSKSQFKAQALEFLRNVEMLKQVLVITHNGKPVVEVIPYKQKQDTSQEAILKSLRGSVLKYEDPTEPAINPEDWDMLK